MDDILSNIEDYNKKRRRKVLIIFDDKNSISICFLTQSYFSVPKDVGLNCTHYILFKLNNKIVLQNIAINHSADMDYKDVIKIYRHCTKEPFNFLIIDTTKDNKFIKNFDVTLQNVTVKDQLKILDRKIKQSRGDYDLYRNAAEISALSSSELNKYEYLTGKDLQYKPDPLKKAKFEYSPLGQVFKKGLKTDERLEGLLKKIKNIEDKTDNKLAAIEN